MQHRVLPVPDSLGAILISRGEMEHSLPITGSRSSYNVSQKRIFKRADGTGLNCPGIEPRVPRSLTVRLSRTTCVYGHSDSRATCLVCGDCSLSRSGDRFAERAAVSMRLVLRCISVYSRLAGNSRSGDCAVTAHEEGNRHLRKVMGVGQAGQMPILCRTRAQWFDWRGSLRSWNQ
jgi:hypothetical protein